MSAAQPADDEYAEKLARLDEQLMARPAPKLESLAPLAGLASSIDPADAELIHQLRQHWPAGGGASLTAKSFPRQHAAANDSAVTHPPVLGRFRIEREIGRGGFAIVFLALDPNSGQRVAIKVPRPEILDSSEARQRFIQEGQASSRLHHPNVIGVLEVGELGPTVFLVTEWAPLGSLAEWLRRRALPLDPKEAATLVEQLARGTEYVHQCGLLHRDIKPSNVLLWPKGDDSSETTLVPRLADFGLAKYVELSLMATGSSVLLGTPLYMAPEQAACDHDSAGPWTDVYSLGVILYELLTSRPPFLGPGLVTLLDDLRVREALPPARLNAAVPPALDIICRKCLAKEPRERYSTAAALAADLERFCTGQRVLARLPGISNRFARWLRQPQRIREAGIWMATLNGAVLIWWSWIIPYFLLAEGLTIDRWAIARDGLVVALLFEIPQILIGAFTILGRRWAVWCGLAWATVNVAFSIVGQSGALVPFGNLYSQMPPMRVAMFGLMTAMFLIELLLYVAAGIAIAQTGKRRIKSNPAASGAGEVHQ